MSSNSDDFWSWWFLSKMFGGGKKSDGESNGKSGCGVIIGVCIVFAILGWLLTKLSEHPVLAVIVLVLIVAIPIAIIVYLIVTRKKRKARKIANEAWGLFNEGKYTLALEKAEPQIEYSADAADLVGFLYYTGEGCDKNLEKAFHCFELGEKDNNEARTYYGMMLLYGEGCEQNIELGKQKLILSSALKNRDALLLTNKFRLTGEFGFPKDVNGAMKDLRKMMDDGDFAARFIVGQQLYEGTVEGITQDKEKGLALIKEAADSGVSNAKEYLESIK